MKKTILIFGALALAVFLLFQVSQYAIISNDLSIEIIIASVAVFFLIVGIFLNKKSLSKKSNLQEKKTQHLPEINTARIEELNISDREYEVLQLIANGLSNKEIGGKLYLSESTIKTHVSNLLQKLDAKRRTQAVKIAKEYKIL